jgi:hypothetical protein
VVSAPSTTKYTHLELGQDVEIAIGHRYTPQQEVRLKYNGREVLYVVGLAVIEASCCGSTGRWAYAIVPGYVINWQSTRNEAGLPVSEVELIRDSEALTDISRIIETRESIPLIEFW